MTSVNEPDEEPVVLTRSCGPDEKGPPLWKTVRLRICLLCAAGFALVYALRVNLSIAIVAMVKETSHEFVNVSPRFQKGLSQKKNYLEFTKLSNVTKIAHLKTGEILSLIFGTGLCLKTTQKQNTSTLPYI